MIRQISWASLAVVFGTLLTAPTLGFSQEQSMPNMPMPNAPVASAPQEKGNVQTGLTLGELEQMALSSNPALAQAAAEIRAATGRKLQHRPRREARTEPPGV